VETDGGELTPLVIAIVGAESTGKSTLAAQLTTALRNDGKRVALVPEYLREFCERHARTPQQAEQAAIAAEQTRRIEAARVDHDVVIADTTALMIAVYSEHVFGDGSLHAQAQADHQRCDLTLLTALDLPWQEDGWQRDGPHVRGPVDALVRRSLQQAGTGYSIVMGAGADRLGCALRAVQRTLSHLDALQPASGNPRWQWHCERCGDAACERRLLPRAFS